jgi:hypothetical protein
MTPSEDWERWASDSAAEEFLRVELWEIRLELLLALQLARQRTFSLSNMSNC